MKKVKKSWMALLLGALLMVTLVGVVWARPTTSPAYKLTIPGGHFHPQYDGIDWYNRGNYIEVDSGSGWGDFMAALPIALPGRFTVEKLTLFAYDDNAGSSICAYLYRVNPWTGNEDAMESVCTTGQASTMQVRSSTDIDPDTIYGGHGGYVYLFIGGNTSLRAYAVQIEYH